MRASAVACASLLVTLVGCSDGASASQPSAQVASSDGSSAPTLPSPSASSSSSAPSPSDAKPAEPWLATTLRESDPRWIDWLQQAESLRLQILVTPIAPDGTPSEPLELRVDAEYFYPASAIKTLVAISALRALSARAGGDIPLGTRIERCRDDKPGCQPPREDEDEEKDPDANGKRKHEKLRVGEEITKLLSYSDNDSYNRLFDIVGHRELNEDMVKLGLPTVRIHHKMNAPAERSRATPRVVLFPPGTKAITMPRRNSDLELPATPVGGLLVGNAYRDGKGLVEEPLSFATKNYVSLRDLQRINLSLISPGIPGALDLGISDAQKKHLIAAMTLVVRPTKRAADHGPLSPGVLDVLPPERIRYVGKSGRAYGFQLENTYIEDTKTHRAYFVTATVYSNPDGILNDDDYGYDEVTRPLLASLGQVLTKKLIADAP